MVNSGFDYRPFVINWCMSLKSIDGYAVDPIERWVPQKYIFLYKLLLLYQAYDSCTLNLDNQN